MTNVKKVVAVLLAFLMIFSSVSVLASAWDASVDDGKVLEISTKFFKEVDGKWVETTKVRPGDTVEARVYLGTDYYSNDSALLFFYDKAFFNHSYSSTARTQLVVNPDSAFATANSVSASIVADPNLNSQIANGYIDSDFTSKYAAFGVTVDMQTANGQNAMYDDSTWLFKIVLTVDENATGEGDLFVQPTTVQNTSNQTYGAVNVPKGPATGSSVDVWAMWLWDANVTLSSQPVATWSTVTFNANGGAFAADDADEFVIKDEIDADITEKITNIPSISRDGYSFMGWVDAADTTPTYEEIIDVPAEMPEDELVLNAYWMENVDITFNTDGGSDIAPHTNVTPYADFADVAEPTKAGYTFVGWDVRGGKLPETYPDVDTTYKAIWAPNVTVSFNTDGGSQVPSISGYEGQEFDASKVGTPTKEGNYFIGWSPELPIVFPGKDTTYTALYDTLTYQVNYIVDGKFVATIQLEYGATIPTNIRTIKVPDGKYLDSWYTDADLSQKLASGETIGVIENGKTLDLYATIKNESYDAIFMLDADTEYTRVETVFEEEIKAPAEPAKAGYVFAGWDPYPGTFDQPNDMVFTAVWEEAENAIQYIVDNKNYDYFDKIPYGADLEIPADPDKEGYTFEGWTWEKVEIVDGEAVTTPLAAAPATMPEYGLVATATWTINQYTITFDTASGTAVDPITKDYNADITEDTTTTRTGYTFTGWVDEEGEKVTVPAKMPAKDMKLTATWEINQYTITFVDTGDVAYEAITKDYLADVGTVADPVKTGYTFTGWENADGDIVTVPAQMPLNGMTLTATWDANSYDAVFDANGGYFDDDTSVSSKTVPTDFNQDIVAPADPKRAGYVFDGWTPAVGKMDDVKGKTFTATWTEAENTAYTVEVYTMGTNGQYGAAQVIPGTGKTNSTATYNISITDGFKVNAKDTTGYDAESNTANITIAAEGNSVIKVYIDRETYTLTKVVDTETTTKDYLFGETVDTIADPTKTGYTFDKWVDANDVATKVPTEMPANDVYIKATWTVNSHTVTWIIDGVEDVDPYNFGETIIAPEAKKTGYSFKGWTPEFVAGTTMPDDDLTFTAVFDANSYDAVFDANGGYFDDNKDVTSKTVPTDFDKDIVAPADPERDGYIFSGWTPAVGKMDDINGKTFTANWSESDKTPYQVIVHTMGTDGKYVAAKPINYTGTTNSTATYNISITDGFKVNAKDTTGYDAVSNTANATIAAEGNTVINVYIDRETYTLTIVVDGKDPVTQDYLFEQTVEVADPEDKTGYTFKAWSPAAPSTMPAENMTITATWNPRNDTAYKVVVNYTDLATGDQTVEFDYTGTTDNAIVVVETMPESLAENTEYVLLSDLAVEHYELDTEKANDLTGKTVKADGTAVVNLYYKAVIYTATFNATNGSYEAAFTDGEKSKEVPLPYNSLVKENAPADPVRTGYTFAGWQGLNDSTRLTANRPFTANWTANPYTLTWVFGNGTNDLSETVNCDALINKQTEPSRTGYSFKGWTWEKLDEEGNAVEVIAEPTTMPAYDVKVTANWEINQYTITFDTDSGTPVTAIKQDYNTDITADTTTTRTGYTFTGWIDVDTGASVTVPAKMPAKNMNLKATWSINTYTLSFNTDGGTTIPDIKQEYNTSVTAPQNPTKDGFTFDGWVDKDGNATTIATTMPAENITYKATWKINKYTITFNSDGGTDVPSVEADYMSDVAKPADPTKTGYTFKGWATTKGVTDAAQAVTFPVKMPLNGTTYYAIWVINQYTIKFDSQGGSAVASVTQNYNTDVAAPTAPTNEGYTFGGWAETAGVTDAAQAVTFPVKVGAAEKTYYAIWTLESYKVNWSSDGTIVKTETVAYNGTLTPPEVAKKGHSLEGWTGMPADKTMDDAGDNGAEVTFTANWKANTYTATFNSNSGSWADGVTTKTVSTVFGQPIDTTTVGLTKDDAAAPTRAGYNFNGWEPAVGNMTEENMTFEAQWIAQGGITYTVETYTMNTDGETYTMTSKTYEGVTDADVDVTPATVAEGFTLVTGAPSVLTGKVQADGSLVLKIYLDRKSFTVTTAVTDGETSTPVSYIFGSTVVVPAEAVKTGYSFDGWYDGTTKYAAGATFEMPARNVTLTGSFTINQYTVAFDSQGGSAVTSVTQNYDTDVAEPTAPTKDGYEFKGWATAAGVTDAAQAVTFPVKVPVGGTTYFAIWDAIEYTITFDSDGGSAVEKIVADYDTAITAPKNPTKAGYDFAGWYSGNDKVDVPAKMPLGGMSLKAQWTPKQYTVTFYKMDKTAVEYTLTAAYLSEYNVPSYSETGYTFNGWVLADGSDAGLTAGGVAKIPLDGGAYYPDVTLNSYDVKFIPNEGNFDGSTEVISFKVEYGKAINAPKDPVREGYTFNGWSPEIPATMPARTQNFVAQWEIESYTVIWDNDGATTTEIYEYGEDLRIPAPTKTGYTLKGWTGLAADATTMPDVGVNGSTVTYKAIWEAKTYDATFNSNSGSWADGVTTKKVPTAFDQPIDTTTVGLTKDEAAAPTRAGYTFNGWEPAVGNMTVEGGMTFEAQWIALGGITYTVETYTMNTDGETYTMTSKTYEGVTDAPVDVTPKTVEEGFALNTKDSVLTGKVQADGSLVLKIYLDRKSFTLKTVVDGKETSSTSYVYGAAVSVATPSQTGWTFSGWDAQVPATMPAEDVTLTGSFTVNKYDVIYMVDGKEHARFEDVAYDTAVEVLDPLTKDGYTFSGWDKEDFTMPDNEVVINGSWTINTHDVIYMVDGEEYTRVKDVPYGTAVEVLDPLTETGYTFSGWDKEDFTMPDGDVTINGSWTAIDYTVTWVDGIDTTEDKVDTYNYKDVITAPDAPTKKGYTFAGWQDGNGTMFAEGATMPAENVVYTAQWTANDGIAYTVETYKMNLDGATYAMTSETLYGKAGEPVSAETPEIEGFTHNPDAEGTKLSGEIAGDGSLVLKVYYDRNKIVVDVNGEDDEYFYEEVIPEPEKPVDPNGGEFKGWEDEDGDPVEFPYTVPDEKDDNITITPVYYYTVKFVSDNAEVFSVENRAGTTYTVPSASKTGYTFKGWTLNDADAGLTVGAEASIPVGGATYVAKWEGNEGIAYTVETYKMNLDGATYAMTSETLYGKAGEPVSAETPEIEGFTHNPDAEGTKLSGEILGDGSLILKVYYDRNKITVDVNDKKDEYFYGEEIEEPTEPTPPTGNEFSGWEDEDGDTVEFPYTVPDEEDKEITIKPVFTPLDYTVTFIADGETVDSFDVTYGTAIDAPKAPAKEGYYFVDWSPAVPATMPAEDMTFTAVYDTYSTGVEYYVNNKLVATVSLEYGAVIPTEVPTFTKQPEGYTFDGWYTEDGEKLADGATLGTEIVKLYATETANTYDAVFNANGGAFTGGETSVTVPTAYDAEIIAPADPTRTGYEFAGWDPFVGTMDNVNGLVFTATWSPIVDAYKVTYYVDGKVYDEFELSAEDEMEIPAEPDKEGYTFKGWAETADSETTVTPPATMPAGNLEYYAVFTVNNYSVTFYDYVALTESPYKSDAPTAVVDTGSYDYAETIEFPEDEPALDSAYFTFKGWSTSVDGEVIADLSKVTMGAGDVAYYAVYDRVQVKLVPAEGSTTVIERDGVRESYNEGDTVTAERYATPASYDYWFVYGVDDFFFTGDDLKANYLAVLGDGTIEVTETEFGCGTGTHIEVIDNVTGEVVEEFYFVIFGDLNGDTLADYADATIMDDEAAGFTFFQEQPYFFRAADLNGDQFMIDFADAAIMDDVAAGFIFIDQTIGYYM